MSNQRGKSTKEGGQPRLAYELSYAVALATGAVSNYCYANTRKAILELDHLLQNAQFVEGWMVLEQETQIALIEHSWCQCADQLIVDPSIVLLIRQDRPVHYFPGIWRDRAEVETLSCSELPYVRSVGIYGADGMGHANYQAAYSAAHELARALASTSDPPKKLVVQPCKFPMTESEGIRLVVRIVSSSAFLRGRNEPSER